MQSNQIEELSQLLKAISHPIRLNILCLLQDEELSVGDIQKKVKTSTANISQHLTILRNQGILEHRKSANYIYNQIGDQRIIELIKTLQLLFCAEAQKETNQAQAPKP